MGNVYYLIKVETLELSGFPITDVDMKLFPIRYRSNQSEFRSFKLHKIVRNECKSQKINSAVYALQNWIITETFTFISQWGSFDRLCIKIDTLKDFQSKKFIFLYMKFAITLKHVQEWVFVNLYRMG